MTTDDVDTGRGGAVRRIGLVAGGYRPGAREAGDLVRSWARDHELAVSDIDVWSDQGRVGAGGTAAAQAAAAGHPDLVVTVGGDGTFLRGARVAAVDDVPVLGVDLGRMGFLTAVAPADLRRALGAWADGTALVEERMTLTMRASRPLSIDPDLDSWLRYGRGPALPTTRPRPSDPGELGYGVALDVTAVNDIVFEKLARDRQASVGVYLADKLFASYSADALVVSSATGSTAYSFAAGGPVLSPRLDAMVFTPVAPHMVFNRSLVLAGDEVVAMRVLDHSGPVAVSVDGQLRGVLDPGDWVAVFAGRRRSRLLALHPTDFYGRLRSRFALADAPAAAADGHPPQEYRPADDVPVPDDVARLFRLR